ncbi:MAG TPA: amino acid adenylation domain-containing protein [Polyangiaceae bacterium]|nr:amino acid adenylation domain-containing protein [Polyangiaceae bacterium]
MRIVAAFAALLARYSEQSSIVLAVARRNAAPTSREQPLLALEIDNGTTIRALLERTEHALSAAAAPGAPLAASVDSAAGSAAIAWLDADSSDPVHSSRDADLTLAIGTNAGRAAFVFDAALFKPSSIARFAGHLQTLLTHLHSNLDERALALPLLSSEEQAWLESVCDGKARTSMTSALVHQRIESHARTTPDAIALRFRDARLSYGELNQRANQIAHFLRAQGVGAGSHVVVCVEPSFDIVLALLGILKAGAVYIPLDPGYPRARKGVILEDTNPKLVITQPHLLSSGDFEGFTTLTLADLPVELGDSQNMELEIAPSQPAYVYYTSGTTGTPKGVLGTHANLLHYVDSAEERYAINARDVMPALARFSFSISMFELLSPLVAGGTLLILEREHVLDPERLARTLSEVTIFHAGPSLLRGLTSYIRRHYASFEAFARVRHASSGGDMVPPELLETLREIFVNAEVFVIYGCSEISCMGATYPVPRGRALTKTYVGRPFDDVLVRLLDGTGQVLPAGIVGEIHFAGSGLTHGYLNRPELSAEKFVTIGGRRFYRTGDRGRLSEDGWLEILGRNDFQTKLRGMRVELAEVEYVLRLAPGVREAVASARDTADQEKILVAYFVAERANGARACEKSARISAIRQYLSAHLPDYMVPAVYVELEALPLNHNLKLDRRALPQPREEDLRAGSAMRLREPHSASEKRLAEIWQRALGVKDIGLDDNFFELGGHSMLAVTMGLEVEEALGVRLDGMDVLREPLEILAAICDRQPGCAPSTVAQARPSSPRATERVEVFHFGRDRSLYGVLHGQPVGAARAALICPPVGQEHVRARFVLTRLAKRLARAGLPTLMFDYFGSGDSLGRGGDASIARWLTDIEAARLELGRRASGARVSAFGVRLGALLLCQATARSASFDKLVLWDSVQSGAEFAREQSALHRRYLRSIAELRLFRRPRLLHRDATSGRELLGTTYSESAWRELQTLSLTPLINQQRAPIHRLETSGRGRVEQALSKLGAERRFEHLDFDCGWQDVARIEDIIADRQISERLTAMVMEES